MCSAKKILGGSKLNFSIKYRPKVFDEVVGHEKLIKEFKKRIVDNDFPNVILFSGNTGTGKTTLQRIIGKNILCNSKTESGECCNECEICKSINNETLNNYYFEFNGSNIGIDEMRTIESLAISKSLSTSRSKVIVIDELQELSSNKKAQKNILKVLEKPLKNTYFILGTMDEWRVDKAILNRSVKYRLNTLKDADIGKYLISICEKEKVDMSDQAKVISTLTSIVRYSEGSVRTAVSYLERVIYSDLWSEEELVEEIGVVTQEKIVSIVNGMLSGDISILENKITNDLLTKINESLLYYYMHISGHKLNAWQSTPIKGIGSFSIETVQFSIGRLAELFKYNYISSYLINFAMIDVINHNKQNKEPRRRRAEPT